MPDTFITVPKPVVDERSSFTANVYVRSGDAGATPTTLDYRIDCLTTHTKLQDWTSLTPGETASISVTAANNRIIGGSLYASGGGRGLEKKQITVSSNRTLATETRDTITYQVRNIGGFVD